MYPLTSSVQELWKLQAYAYIASSLAAIGEYWARRSDPTGLSLCSLCCRCPWQYGIWCCKQAPEWEKVASQKGPQPTSRRVIPTPVGTPAYCPGPYQHVFLDLFPGKIVYLVLAGDQNTPYPAFQPAWAIPLTRRKIKIYIHICARIRKAKSVFIQTKYFWVTLVEGIYKGSYLFDWNPH